MKIIKSLFVGFILLLMIINLGLIHLQALTLYLYLGFSMPSNILLYLRMTQGLKESKMTHGIILAGPIVALTISILLTAYIL